MNNFREKRLEKKEQEKQRGAQGKEWGLLRKFQGMNRYLEERSRKN